MTIEADGIPNQSAMYALLSNLSLYQERRPRSSERKFRKDKEHVSPYPQKSSGSIHQSQALLLKIL
ncbi:hypothetical protein DLM75_13200 [Leptospira stimsonii]|uniref:Uncharacterized protein n=1 Tax=Leptospira stimsonii TaxID=2202203 RepID=A0A396Z722_9LEPT|nr:hypothetical protein DLM75_13200 [Leptospira stimsonii]